MRTFLLIDGMNLFFRAIHVHGTSTDLHIELTLQTIFNSIRKAWNIFEGDHVILCLEGSSWRKSIYPKYKLNRKIKAAKRTPTEVENEKFLLEAFEDMVSFFRSKTNVTVLQAKSAEADDLIALWVQSHDNDKNIIISSDKDYIQLLNDNVMIFDGVAEQITTKTGYYDIKWNKIKDKDGNIKLPPEKEYFLFKKCIRGDKSDNIFSAYPGVREKGTKIKVGIIEAFEDRNEKGFAWNNFMNQRWLDHNDEEHIVKNDYELNKKLIDLTMQPDDVKIECLEEIVAATQKPPVKNVGFNLLKYFGKWGLKRLIDYPADYARILNSRYSNIENDK